MINSRDINELHPKVKKLCQDFIEACKAKGITIKIISTYRDNSYQQAIYNVGRTKPGKRITDAKPGYSFHNYRLAFDFLPTRNGVYDWNDVHLFEECGKIGESLGLVWGGNFKKLKDLDHLQYSDGLTLLQLLAGEKLAN